jgi:hypothetical protein
MKTIAVILSSSFIYLEMQAQDQIKHGVYSLDGSISYTSSTNRSVSYSPTSGSSSSFEYDESSFSFIPSVSYFIIDQVELAFSAGYARYSMDLPYPSSVQKSTYLGASMGLRSYVPYGTVAPFIGVDCNVNWNSTGGGSYSKPNM